MKTTLTREAAWNHLNTWTETSSLLRHARAVELVMRAAAHHYGPGEAAVEAWGIAGMLHDADYEKWPDQHPDLIVSWLKDRGEAEIAYAISAHYTKWGVPYNDLLEKALLACDELTGFIMACSLMRPDGVTTIEVKSVRKKLKDKKFAAGVDRFEVQEGARLLETELADHIQFIIDSLRPHAEELGLLGTAAA